MKKSYLVLTHTGDGQEETTSLAKPVIVMRDDTERRKSVAAGKVLLAGTAVDSIVKEISRLLSDDVGYKTMSATNAPMEMVRRAVG